MLLIAWRQSLPPLEQQSEDERELTMNWEQVYERWERKVKAQGRREGKGEGKAEGKAEAVLAVLEGRGLTVTAAQRKQILACSDTTELDAWLRAAGTTPSVKALLSSATKPRPREKAL
jgi:flagellar biosynthesis/type III secretory pathway protein FliH